MAQAHITNHIFTYAYKSWDAAHILDTTHILAGIQ